MDRISIMVVDDHAFIRMGIVALIGTCEDMVAVAQASNGQEAVEQHAIHDPDIVLIDLRLPDITGVEVIRRIRWRAPESNFIVLTTYEGDEDIHQAIQAGARGYLVKGMPSDMLATAIRRVHAGGRFLPPPVLRALQSRTPNAELTMREREVLALLAKGMTNREIATRLAISEVTVKCHVGVILMRLNVTDRTQAVLEALKRGMAHL
ncbi:MAG TPA: response regulator transcription factor [Terracidiphilus sp.]|jgi:DNA-binding NarL/FixJ family response regulator|nr:response regulator transcription factor [Terracidiphilus sp.]